MRFCSIFYISIILFSSSASAEIDLSIGPGISLIAANGSEIESSSLFESNRSITLPNGKNQLLVQYSLEIRSSGSLEMEYTDPHVLVFNASDKSLRLLVSEVKGLSEFRQFNSGKFWSLKDSTGRLIKHRSKPLLKEGFQINRDYEQELEELNNTGGDLSINNPVILSVVSPRTNEINKKANLINLPETLLRYWYLNADIETRQRFKSWVSDK